MLTEALDNWAAADSDRVRFTYLGDDGSVQRLSDVELWHRARVIAAELLNQGSPGDRVLLAYPPGLDFVAGFFGCLYAGMLAVPVHYPRPNRPMIRHSAIARDCRASMALTTERSLRLIDAPGIPDVHWIATDNLEGAGLAASDLPARAPDKIAFLQYTSGSTSEPKGVMVSHANLIRNLEIIREGFHLTELPPAERIVFNWMPAYHDMGLIGSLLGAFYNDGETIIMSPASFLQRPLRWMHSISKYRATITGAPCFAYRLCAEKVTQKDLQSLDLSCLYLAGCGAEPIEAEALERFAAAFAGSGFNPKAFYPCYGLAESTLMVTGGDGPGGITTKTIDRKALSRHRMEPADDSEADALRVVSCGKPHLDTKITIVDPETRRVRTANEIGEVWVTGETVSQGYWRSDPEQNVFSVQLEQSDGSLYLRTGDLGFVSEGALYVTGRIKDLIIIRGQNHYPQDIERTATLVHESLAPTGAAAFAVEVDGQERLVVIHEVDRAHGDVDLDKILRELRVSVATEHELDVHEIVLIRPLTLPRTTSGKVQRFICRDQYRQGSLRALARWKRSDSLDADVFAPIDLTHPPQNERALERFRQTIETALLAWIRQEGGVSELQIDTSLPFAEIGIDSLRAVELSAQLESWLGVELTPIIAWQ